MTEAQSIRFSVPGEPAAWHVYTRYDKSLSKAKLKAYQETVRIAARDAMRGMEPSRGPVDLEVWFYRGIPKSAPKTEGPLLRWVREHILMKPDLTNFQKAAEDALKEEAVKGVSRDLLGIVFIDDGQVTDISSHKRYDPNPRTEFLVKFL